MLRDRRLGALLAVLGLLANNYVYLHDLILDSHQGLIALGGEAKAGVVISALIALAGIAILLRAPGDGGAR